MIRPPAMPAIMWFARLRYALRHICWPKWCGRHRVSYASAFCPECNGERLARLERSDERKLARHSGLSGDAAIEAGIRRMLAFDLDEVRRHVRAGRRNGLHRGSADEG